MGVSGRTTCSIAKDYYFSLDWELERGVDWKRLAFELVSDVNPQRPITVMRWWERR